MNGSSYSDTIRRETSKDYENPEEPLKYPDRCINGFFLCIIFFEEGRKEEDIYRLMNQHKIWANKTEKQKQQMLTDAKERILGKKNE